MSRFPACCNGCLIDVMAKQVNDDAYWSHGDDTEPVSFVPGVDVDNNFKKFISDQNTKRRLRVENVVSSLISIVLTHLKKAVAIRTTCGSLNLKLYLTAFCNMTVTHGESAVGLVETK